MEPAETDGSVRKPSQDNGHADSLASTSAVSVAMDEKETNDVPVPLVQENDFAVVDRLPNADATTLLNAADTDDANVYHIRTPGSKRTRRPTSPSSKAKASKPAPSPRPRRHPRSHSASQHQEVQHTRSSTIQHPEEAEQSRSETPDDLDKMQRRALITRWAESFPDLESSCSRLLSAFPLSWSLGQQLLALDEALIKTTLLQPAQSVQDFTLGIESWVAQWINSSSRPNGITVPAHLRGKKVYQEFWAIDRDIQSYQTTHVITAALLRLAKVRISEKYEDMKAAMRVTTVRRKKGQTAAAKAKDVIFRTTFPDPDEREAAQRRFEAAQKASNVLLDLCRDHSYGVLILIPPDLSERSLRPTAAEFQGFRHALRFALSDRWQGILKLCGQALVAISEGRQPQQATLAALRDFGTGCLQAAGTE